MPPRDPKRSRQATHVVGPPRRSRRRGLGGHHQAGRPDLGAGLRGRPAHRLAMERPENDTPGSEETPDDAPAPFSSPEEDPKPVEETTAVHDAAPAENGGAHAASAVTPAPAEGAAPEPAVTEPAPAPPPHDSDRGPLPPHAPPRPSPTFPPPAPPPPGAPDPGGSTVQDKPE